MNESKVAVVGACDLAKVNRLALRENYERITGTAPSGKKTEDILVELEKRYAERHAADPEANIEKCTDCGGWSDPAELPEACPYCNDMKEYEPLPAKAEPVAMVDDGNDDCAIDSVALERQVEVEKGARKSKTEVAEQKMVRRLPATPPKPSAPLVSLVGTKPTNSDALDAAVAKYRRCGEDHAGGMYDAGLELKRMCDYSLWQQRLGEGGKPKYKSFEQFMKAELGLSKTVGNRLLVAVDTFSRDDFQSKGFETIAMIAGAPTEMHQALLQEAESGVTTRQLAETIQTKKQELGIVVRPPPPGQAPPRTNAATLAAAQARREKREKENSDVAAEAKERAAITVGLKTTTFTEKMKAKGCLPGQPPASKGEIRNAVVSEEVAAVLRDLQPYFKVRGINGVTMTVALVVDAGGQLAMKGDTRRMKDDEEEEDSDVEAAAE